MPRARQAHDVQSAHRRQHRQAAGVAARAAADKRGVTSCSRTMSALCRFQLRTYRCNAADDATVELRMGAVAWAIWQRSVSHSRSSNRTCRSPASGSPTGFTVGHTASTNRTRLQHGKSVSFAPRYSSLGRRLSLMVCSQAHRQSPRPLHLRKRTRSQGPFVRRHYSASTVVRPCPTPARAVACRDVEAATLAHDGSPPITRTTLPTCRAHYPGGSSGCACRLLPRSCSLPQMAGGSASALSLWRCYGRRRGNCIHRR